MRVNGGKGHLFSLAQSQCPALCEYTVKYHYIRNYKEDVHAHPCGRIGRAYAHESELRGEYQRSYDSAHQLDPSAYHGQRAPSYALQRVAIDEYRRERDIKHTLPKQILFGHIHHFVRDVRREQSGHRFRAYRDEPQSEQSAHGAYYHAPSHADAYVGELARAVILPAIRSDRTAERIQALGRKVVDLGSRRVSRDRGGTELVERGLLDHHSDRSYRKLQRHRQSDRHMLPIKLERIGEMFLSDTVRTEPCEKEHETAYRRDRLRKHRRPSRARNAHAEVNDEQKVETYVEHRSQYQEYQRRTAVADRAQHGRAEVVKHRRAESPINGHDIVVGIIDYVVRRIHQVKQRHGGDDAYRGKDNGQNDAQQQRRSDTPPDALFVPRSEKLTCLDREARGQSLNETDDEKRDRAGRAHARQGVVVYRLPDDYRVDHAVKLLENIADEYRYREYDDVAKRLTYGKVSCHKTSSDIGCRLKAFPAAAQAVLYYKL